MPKRSYDEFAVAVAALEQRHVPTEDPVVHLVSETIEVEVDDIDVEVTAFVRSRVALAHRLGNDRPLRHLYDVLSVFERHSVNR